MAGPGVPPGLAAHAAVTRASHLRQLGGHAAARGLDAYALRRAGTAPPEPALEADGADPPAARADALVGLAADAVGLGEPELAERLLAAAAAQAHPSWRCRVRVGWVQAELALARGRPAEAVEPARLAFAAARRAGSLRHVVKSGIVLAVARAAADPAAAPEAVTELDRAAATAESCGLLPLLWPARLAAADLLAAGAGATPGDTPNGASTRRRAAITAMRVIHRRSDPIGRRLIGESRWFGAT
ncbi:MAG TPA: hypothetical protein VD813_08650 [Pseudonocardia sp.]|nr:hypothetical protein [Pseudonocardia sp.]